jgi:hypothetical protein
MPKRRVTASKRHAQDQRRLTLRSILRGTPDPQRLSRAFIGLALARAAGQQASRLPLHPDLAPQSDRRHHIASDGEDVTNSSPDALDQADPDRLRHA